ncbi:MAG: carbohydrate ABC transporter permease [Limnochordaceae bacterium]|nr:carbohydrate ABC transporter permease [Limnochordaceae bacterium]
MNPSGSAAFGLARPGLVVNRRARWTVPLLHLVLLAGAAAMVLPFIWMVLTSFKRPDEVFTVPLSLWPRHWVWSNYPEAWASAPFTRYFLNTVFTTTATTLGQLVTGILAAYAFARMEFWGREVIFTLFLGTMMIPDTVATIPNYLVISKLGWLDTYQALIVPWTVSVFGIFLLRQFFLTIPKELEEAALIDGASRLTFLWRVMLPLARPAVLTVTLFSVVGGWNSFFWPLIVTNSDEMRTVQVGVSAFFQEYGTQPNLAMAASTVAVIPVIILFLFIQRQFVEGIARTGIR